MPWARELWPATMRRVAVVAPSTRFRRVLVEVADAGCFEPDPSTETARGPAVALAERMVAATGPAAPAVEPYLSVEPVDAQRLADDGAVELLLGEASLEAHAAAAREVATCTVLPGWVRADDLTVLRTVIAPHGGALADLPGRRGLVPPTASAGGTTGNAFRPLVTTYATVPYRDIDPTLFAVVAYMVMFGMMFGDVAHGLAILAVGLVARFARHGQGGPPSTLRRAAPFLIGAGAAATAFGLLYGEAFGPTGLVPTLWLRPLDEPQSLLVAGLVVGGALLAITFALSIVNRWREDGPAVALYDPTGVAGGLLLVGVGLAATGVVTSGAWWWRAGVALLVVGSLLVFIGLFVKAGARPAGIAQAFIELFDTLLRLGSNIVSFTRLAAFGLTHAVISEVVWDGTSALWRHGGVATGAGVLLFVAGNAAAFALGVLVAAIQALRLEYYELFSRLFASSGRPFVPWHVPARRQEPS